MFRWLYVLLHLLAEAGAARRDTRIRFLKAQIEILRRKLGGNRVIPSPDDRTKLLAIGAELRHDVADIIGIVNHFICFGLRHLEFIAQTFVQFYNWPRPHRGLGDAILDEGGMGPMHVRIDNDVGPVRCRRFLGGLLRHYYRTAA